MSGTRSCKLILATVLALLLSACNATVNINGLETSQAASPLCNNGGSGISAFVQVNCSS